MLGLKYWLGGALLLFLFSCDNDGNSIGTGSGNFDDFGVAFIDTSTVLTSTVLLDSIPTSATNTMLIGNYQDEKLGKTSASTFFQLSVNTWNPSEDATMDSVVLVLPYSGYYYGDTTKTQTFRIGKVTGDFKIFTLPQYWADEDQYSLFYTAGIFNNRSLPDEEISTFSFKPRPHADTVTARLPDVLGNYWLAEALKENGILSNTARFQDYFKGFSIRPISGEGSIVGFNTDAVKIKVYYSEYENGQLTQRTYALTYNSLYQQYNNIKSDRSATSLASLSPTSKIISSKLTDEEVFIQAGVGIVTKIQFPHIKEITNLSDDYILVNTAYLKITPIKNSYSGKYSLPKTLALYQTDQTNLPTSPLYIDYSQSTQQTATITFDDEYGTNSGYTFSITEYIQYLVNHDGVNNKALLLTTAPASIFKTVDRIYLGGALNPDYKMKLEIYYTRKN